MTIDKPWLPEHPVDADLAAALVHGQFPDLAAWPAERVGEGWDCDCWRFGDLVFRFPRRPVAVRLLRTEQAALGWLGPQLPVAVPAPAAGRAGEPALGYPAPWYGHPYVDGATGDRAALDAAGRAAAAPALAGFLRALHALDVDEAAAAGIPPDSFRADVPRSAERGLARLPALAGTPWEAWIPAAEALLAAPPPPPPGWVGVHGAGPLSAAAGPAPRLPGAVVLHGDLYARHLIFGPGPALTGVIDWGDTCLGDRAIDLSIAFTFLPPPAARPAFWTAYGEVDQATQARARVIGLARYGINLLAYARDVGDAGLEAEAGQALQHALT